MTSNSWSYEEMESNRSAKLSMGIPYRNIVDEIADSAEILCFHNTNSDELPGENTRRPTFNLKIDKDFFDLFFNSENGYRGQYFDSPFTGLEGNRYFIDSLIPKLMLFEGLPKCPKEREEIQQSLKCDSAKVWLAEKGNKPDSDCDTCSGEWDPTTRKNWPIIRNGKWEDYDDWGCRAPRYSKIRIFGAFYDDIGNEIVPKRKRYRSYELHKKGWS